MPRPGFRTASCGWSGSWTRTVQARLPVPSAAIRGLDGVTFISMPVLGRGAARVAIGSRPPSVPGPSVTAPVAGSTVRSSIQRI